MTDIDALEGLALDRAVAEARGVQVGKQCPANPNEDIREIDGWEWECALCGTTGYINRRGFSTDVGHLIPVPEVSDSIAAAWELWQELKADGYDTSVYEEGDGLMSFYVCRDKCEECLRRNEVAICYFHDLDELPTAIARAYLKALKAKASD